MLLFEFDKVGCPRTKAKECTCEHINTITEAEQTVVAQCILEHSDAVKGTILLMQAPNTPTLIKGTITGLEPGLHGFHIHEFGDMSDGCKSMGGHYNPDGVDHGDINKGHVGDLGNITADESGTAKFTIEAKRIDLIGERSVIGRGFVVHEDQDDLGKGGDAESLKTGNAGERLACGVITLRENVQESVTPGSRRPLKEAARIQHAEDIVFWEGSKGATRALQSLRNLDQGGHKQVTIKWDGSPAIIFGRNAGGEFILTDKSGFTAKGYDGRSKSAKELEQMFLNRSGGKNRENPGYVKFAGNMKAIFDEYERATPKDYVGFFKGDLLYFTTPPVKENNYVFKPNIVEYAVDVNSDLGKKIGASKTGVVIHRQVQPDGTETPLQDPDIFVNSDVLVVPPITAERAPQVPHAALNKLEQVIKKDAAAIDSLLDQNKLRQMQMSDFSNILYAYTNSKVDTGLSGLGSDFGKWLETSKVSDKKKAKIAEYINNNTAGFSALWETVNTIMMAKDQVIADIDAQGGTVQQNIGGQAGGEGYVLAHPEGDIKLVPRSTFSAANRAVQR